MEKALFIGKRKIQNGIKNLNLIKLKISCNPRIFDVSNMTNLKELWINFNSGVDQKGIKNLNLTELHVRDNKKINDFIYLLIH